MTRDEVLKQITAAYTEKLLSFGESVFNTKFSEDADNHKELKENFFKVLTGNAELHASTTLSLILGDHGTLDLPELWTFIEQYKEFNATYWFKETTRALDHLV